MGSVFEATVLALRKMGTPHALIGAVAMAGRGVMRSTDDLDLFVVDRAVLRPDSWTDLEVLGFTAQVRLGDDEDPLAGVVRLSGPRDEHPVDVVVDVQALLEAGDRPRLIAEVNRTVGRLPPGAQEHWQKVAPDLGG